ASAAQGKRRALKERGGTESSATFATEKLAPQMSTISSSSTYARAECSRTGHASRRFAMRAGKIGLRVWPRKTACGAWRTGRSFAPVRAGQGNAEVEHGGGGRADPGGSRAHCLGGP